MPEVAYRLVRSLLEVAGSIRGQLGSVPETDEWVDSQTWCSSGWRCEVQLVESSDQVRHTAGRHSLQDSEEDRRESGVGLVVAHTRRIDQ